MQTLTFKQLPLAVKIVVGIAVNNAWWSIEEFVIDRHHIWRYMPYYRVADPCVWDLAVALITTFLIWRASTRRSPGTVPATP